MKVEYHYLNKFGAVKGFKKSNPNREKKTLLVLDSSVCLDIVNIVSKRNINKESKRKAFELIKYSQKKSTPPFEILALLELSLDKSTYQLDTDKFFDFFNKLKFAFQFPIERLRKNDFDYFSNFIPSEKKDTKGNLTPVIEQIMVHYSALLKIREIASKGLSKQKSQKNILEFLDWMNSELNLILGLEYQLAIQIFGGNTGFNSMIKVNSTKEKALKALWGTAWDLMHARVSRNSTQLSAMVNEDINSIFITNDKRLYELIAPQIEFASEFDRSKISITAGEENYPPHFDYAFMEKLNSMILEISEKRVSTKVSYPHEDYIKELIGDMEKNLS
ncbi:MAG: hypothetical protein GQ574_26595 [Crocinitomix sp.]|nr:hypothetical protein [Crocinitomix sp.]